MQTPFVGAVEVSAPIETAPPLDVTADARRHLPAKDEKSGVGQPLRFRYFRRKITLWWKTLATLLVAVPAALTIAFVVHSLTQNAIIIEPLSTPKVMADNGYKPEIAATHFRAAINRAMLATDLGAPSVSLRAELPDIIVPTVGISAQTLASSIRRFLPNSRAPIISGEFTVADDQLWLNLRSGGREIYSSTRGVSPGRVRQLMDAATPAVLLEVWPTYHVLLLFRTDPDRALEVANRIVAAASSSRAEVSQLHFLKSSDLWTSTTGRPSAGITWLGNSVSGSARTPGHVSRFARRYLSAAGRGEAG